MAFFSVTGLLAQPTLIDAPDTMHVNVDTLLAGGGIEAYWSVANETDEPMTLMVTRLLIDTVSPFNYPYQSGGEGAYERFCWGPTCFNYGTDSSPENAAFLITIEPDSINDSFHGDYYPNGIVGASTFRYCFHPVGSIVQGTCHNVTFVADGTVGVGEREDRPFGMTSMFPNPAVGQVTIQFDHAKRGQLEIRNLVGQIMEISDVAEGMKTKELSVGHLPAGICLVTYRVDGAAVSTQRLVLR